MRKVCDNSEENLANLIAQKMPMIRRMAYAALCPGLELEDAVQEGVIGLFSAIGSFSEGKGASFNTYANVCVQNAVASAARAASRKKHLPLNSALELTNEPLGAGAEDVAIQNESYREMLSNIKSRLSPLEKRVLSLHLNGATNSQISAELSMQTKAVENALSRVRRKLR